MKPIREYYYLRQGPGVNPRTSVEVIRRVPKLHTLGLWMRNKDTITIRLLLLSFLFFYY